MYNITLIRHFLCYLSQKTDISRNILKQWNVINGICVIHSFNFVLTSISHYYYRDGFKWELIMHESL